MKLEPYICKNCGGRINVAKMRCEYCDTPYKDENLKRITVETVYPGQHLIASQIEIDYEDMRRSPEYFRDLTLSQLRKQLADGLLGFMKIETADGYSPGMGRTQIIRGTVKVIDPTFYDY